jgi:hypothetical protein
MKQTKPAQAMELRSLSPVFCGHSDAPPARLTLFSGGQRMTEGPSGVTSSRGLVVSSLGLFAVSSVFPLAASVLEVDRPPTWVGVLDVAIAIALVALGMVIVSRKARGFAAPVIASAFRAYRGLANALLILLALFFIAGETIRWSTLLPGLAWRGWLLVMVLPSWLSLRQTEQRSVEG